MRAVTGFLLALTELKELADHIEDDWSDIFADDDNWDEIFQNDDNWDEIFE